MERFKNIMFASFGEKEDRAALDRANRLALANQASLTLVRVLEDLPFAASCILPKKRLADFRNASINQAQHELDELSAKLDSSVQVKTKVLFGKPFIELIRAVLSDGHDLLIKSKLPSVKDGALDSTDLQLLRKCPCPVWIIKPNQRKPFGKILIAVDPDPSDSGRLSLHADLIKIGISLADRENGKVEVVHTWELEGESMFRSPRFNMSEDEIQKMSSEVESIHRKWIDDLLEPYQDNKPKVVMEKGGSATTLVKLIEKKKPDIVVMGTVARTGLPGLLIGNTAEFVLGQITCSILTLKPKGFKTPVT